MKVAFRKSTQEVINDFQTGATDEALISNAIKAGIPQGDIEIRDITEQEFFVLEEETNAAGRIALQEAYEQQKNDAFELQSRLNLSDKDVADLRLLLTLK